MVRAADLLVECLLAHGADRLFCVPGESYLALLDALHGQEAVDVVVCRHEGGAGMAAVADAKLTGKPGLLAVSRGPGAMNAAIALHLAEQDAVPLVVLVGQVARFERGRGAFQEMDYARVFGSFAKHVEEVTDAFRLPEALARAWAAAQSGTPGPAVLALPEDMLTDDVTAAVIPPISVPVPGPSQADITRAAQMLSKAERPLIIAGGGFAAPATRAALKALAEGQGIPVATTFKHQEVFDNFSPLYAGNLGFKVPPSLWKTLAEADLILALGTRLGDVPTQGYKIPAAPEPTQPLIHVWPDPAVLTRLYHATLAVPAEPSAFAAALAQAAPEPPDRAGWAARCNGAALALHPQAKPRQDGLDFGVVAAELARQAPRDAIVTTDSGNFSGWVHQFWPWDGSQLAVGAVGGAMGLGIPGAVAASLRFPTRCVLGFAGDGGTLMTGAELATAQAKGATPKIVVADNGTYGTIRLHQERDFPARISGTDLDNPDFAAWAASFGLASFSLAPGDDIEATVTAFLAHPGAALLCVATSAEAISAYVTVTQLRERSKQAGKS
ncbi:thiamine pyrophosphate-binding protein [Oceanicola sp. 502str15]|uniref:thiamine pyrophosphate-binding protein n=1 Tax=Oceanicola sp. 502str15 TaxID=2696061 RepID=UPI002094796D|nr:thiamine pyrophosphate-binding protein [Oceanicola sp. 502str15]MCO6381561.1 acetolactate synthase [Oceanicola sp. 502str15]